MPKEKASQSKNKNADESEKKWVVLPTHMSFQL